MLPGMSQISASLSDEGEPALTHVWSVAWQKATQYTQKLLIKGLGLTCIITSLRFSSFIYNWAQWFLNFIPSQKFYSLINCIFSVMGPKTSSELNPDEKSTWQTPNPYRTVPRSITKGCSMGFNFLDSLIMFPGFELQLHHSLEAWHGMGRLAWWASFLYFRWR